MAGINGVSNYNLYDGLFGSANSLYGDYNFKINTSTEKFRDVTGYKPVNKTGGSESGNSGLVSESAKAYLAAIKNFGSKLREATANASQAGQSIFKQLSGVSSNNEAMSVSVSNQADAAEFDGAQGSKSVSVQQLASAQRNNGASLDSKALSGAKTGTNQFSVEKGGKSYDFSVNINATDSARTAQEKMADAINNQNIGITAKVQYDEGAKKSALVITSNETGEKNAFTLQDEGSGNLVETLGVGRNTQEARDARYTVDGEQQTSASNTVDLGDGLTGTLKKAGPEEINAAVEKDVDGIAKAVNNMVEQFNGLLKTANGNSGDRSARSLSQRLDSIASSYEPSLARIGITQNEKGYLEVDEKKLKTAFENGSAERALGNETAGFTQRLSQVAKQADSDPNRFMSVQSRNNMRDESTNDLSDLQKDYHRFMSSSRNVQLANMSHLFNLGA
ncbi:MAG: flagellar filament capping protein FliD [Clostridiales bacterium]|jgi:flagellar hook-associated protein 2|nr:flagellar filament capping protein FliD [Clostridiales bacterium]